MSAEPLSGRWMLGAYLPALAALVAVAVLVTLLPSTAEDTSVVAKEPTGAGRGTEGVGPAPETCARVELGFGELCAPAYDGDNGGATDRGVSGDAIKIVLYQPSYDDQTTSLVAQTAQYEAADVELMLDAWEAFANRHYQFYGRRVDLVYQEGPGSGLDAAEQAADAVRLAVEEEAFLVLAETGTPALFDELSRREVPSISLLLQFAAEYYEERAPFHYGLLPDLDLVLDHVAEYWCGRLEGSPAEHAGDPAIQEKARKLGIIYAPEFNDGGPRLTEKLKEGCDAAVAATTTYTGDITTATQQAVNIVGQFRDAGVTTVACVCDPIAPIFFTGQATTQGYRPEWLHTGYFATDADVVGRVYDQDQWAHSFGPSSVPLPGPNAESRGRIAYENGAPEADDSPLDTAGHLWDLFDVAFAAIEAAGPDLNEASLQAALFDRATFPEPSGPTQSAISFGDNGPSPYTAVDDMGEIWWDPARIAPNQEKGTSFYVDGGRRYRLGDWPESRPEVFIDDGSPQPPPED